MGVKELCEKYGRKQTTRALNAAVRAEIPGGAQTLDLLKDLYPLRNLDPRWSETYRRLQATRDAMVGAIALKYDLKILKERSADDANER